MYSCKPISHGGWEGGGAGGGNCNVRSHDCNSIVTLGHLTAYDVKCEMNNDVKHCENEVECQEFKIICHTPISKI